MQSLEHYDLQLEIESRALRTNRQPLDANPEDYDTYLIRICGTHGHIMRFDEWAAQQT